MSKTFCIVASAALAVLPSAAWSNSATTRIVLRVPVQCAIDVLGGSIEGRRVTLQVRRHCNTGHDIVIQSAAGAEWGDVTLHYNGQSTSLGGYRVLPQTEGYYDGVDQVIVEASSGSSEDIQELASSLQLSVVAA